MVYFLFKGRFHMDLTRYVTRRAEVIQFYGIPVLNSAKIFY
jgi:hypothetical protein